MRLINADELTDIYTVYDDYGDKHTVIDASDIADAATINAIVIPENPTNGDVILAIILATFHNVTLFADAHGYGYVYSGDVRCAENYLMTYNKDWWNAPFEQGVTE